MHRGSRRGPHRFAGAGDPDAREDLPGPAGAGDAFDERQPRRDPACLRSRIYPSFAQLEIFLAVADLKSFIGAARRTGVSQPAISQAIARLEDLYGTDLFIRRRGASLVPTRAGEALVPLARVLLHTLDQSFERAAASARSEIGRLTVGLYPGLLFGRLRQGIARFVADCPKVELRLVEGAPGDLYARLCERALDLLVAPYIPDLRSPAMAQEVLFEDRVVALLPDGHKLAGRPCLARKDLAGCALLLADCDRQLPDWALIETPAARHAVSHAMLGPMVAMGMGIALAPAGAVASIGDGVIATAIEGDAMRLPVTAVWHADDADPVRHRFVAALR